MKKVEMHDVVVVFEGDCPVAVLVADDSAALNAPIAPVGNAPAGFDVVSVLPHLPVWQCRLL